LINCSLVTCCSAPASVSFTLRAASSVSVGKGELSSAKKVRAIFQSIQWLERPCAPVADRPNLLWYILGLSLSFWVGPWRGVIWNLCEKLEIFSNGSYFQVRGMDPCLKAITSWLMKVCYSSVDGLPRGPSPSLIWLYRLLRSAIVNLVDSIWSAGTWMPLK